MNRKVLLAVLAGAIGFAAMCEQKEQEQKPAQRAGEVRKEAAGGVDSGWLGKVQENIRALEYEPSLQEKDAGGVLFEKPQWHFANRAQNLRMYLVQGGISVMPRAGDKPWKWNYSLAGIGREAAPAEVLAAEPYREGNKIEYDRGIVTEWYFNTEKGIEQGFEIRERPGGN